MTTLVMDCRLEAEGFETAEELRATFERNEPVDVSFEPGTYFSKTPIFRIRRLENAN